MQREQVDGAILNRKPRSMWLDTQSAQGVELLDALLPLIVQFVHE
jgi:hypothetical protein